MPGWLILIALQSAPVASATAPAPESPPPQRFSILVPVADEPCVRQPSDSDAVVCAKPLPSQKLPYPNEVVPDGPMPSNPERSGMGALAAMDTPCPISRSCVVGFGPPIMPLIAGAVGLVKDAFAKKPDKTGRVPIALDDSGAPKGRLEP